MTTLSLCDIRTDGGTQPRAVLDLAVIAEYAEALENGATFPPSIVFYDGTVYWLADGFHRYEAHRQTARSWLEVDIRQGTQAEAQWYSYSVNQAHGLRRTNEDKRRAVEAALRHAFAGQYSDNQIAQHCGVSQPFVSKLRPSYNDYKIDLVPRLVTRAGQTYTMQTANIGRKPEPMPEPEELEDEPEEEYAPTREFVMTYNDTGDEVSRFFVEDDEELIVVKKGSQQLEPPAPGWDEARILAEAQRIKAERTKERRRSEKLTEVLNAEAVKTDVYDLRHCSCRDLFASGIRPDAVITDPPYPREFLPVFSELAAACAAANVPLVAVMSGQSYLPEVMQRLTEHLTYRWTLAYLTPGGQAVQQWPAKVNTFWKPVLLFGQAIEWLGDVTKSAPNDNDKRFHAWGQSESGMADLVQRLTKPGQLICDPFLGGGTTALVALALGRRFVGCDTDAACIAQTTQRIEAQI